MRLAASQSISAAGSSASARRPSAIRGLLGSGEVAGAQYRARVGFWRPRNMAFRCSGGVGGPQDGGQVLPASASETSQFGVGRAPVRLDLERGCVVLIGAAQVAQRLAGHAA